MNVEQLTNANTIELYVSPSCPYCREARAFYDAKQIRYTVYDAQNDPLHRRKMLDYAHGDPTVPVIIVDGVYAQSGWGSPPRG